MEPIAHRTSEGEYMPCSIEEIGRMPAGLNKCRAYVIFAEQCMANGMECEAADAFREAMSGLPWDSAGDERLLLERAYHGLCALSLSEDECTWEIASQIAGDYARHLESTSSKTDSE